MTEGMTTVLDLAHAAMEEAPEDDAARLRFYERVADAELFLLLAEEAEGDRIAPRLFPLEDGPFVLAFDREERLAEFADGPAPYAALPGRVVVRMLAEQSIGLGLNLGVAPSEILLPPEALIWLAQTLAAEPGAAEALPQTFLAPGRLPQPLLAALQAKLSMMGGLAVAALLARVAYADGRQGHMLAFIGAAPAAEPALAKAVAEALTFSGIEAGELDVTFLAADSAAALSMARVAMRLDLPQPERPAEPAARAAPGPAGPGMDPTKPPILR